MGERGVATQYLGIPKALVEQIEYGLRGGALQSDVEKGVFGAHGRDLPAILAAEHSRAASLARFAGQGIMQLPRASQQMAATALVCRARRPRRTWPRTPGPLLRVEARGVDGDRDLTPRGEAVLDHRQRVRGA